MSKVTQAAYRPVSLGASLAAASIAGVVFKQIWRRVGDSDDAPSALQLDHPLGKVVAAAAIQGLIFAIVKALIDRGGAQLFERLTGSQPGN